MSFLKIFKLLMVKTTPIFLLFSFWNYLNLSFSFSLHLFLQIYNFSFSFLLIFISFLTHKYILSHTWTLTKKKIYPYKLISLRVRITFKIMKLLKLYKVVDTNEKERMKSTNLLPTGKIPESGIYTSKIYFPAINRILISHNNTKKTKLIRRFVTLTFIFYRTYHFSELRYFN